MIYREEIELEYDLFLAEQELYNHMIESGFDIISESTGLVLVTESVKNTIKKYLGRISEALQNAWDKFKDIFKNKETEYLKTLENKIKDGPEPKFSISNYPNYDLNKLDNLKNVKFDYEELKNDVASKDAILKKYFSDVYTDDSLSFQQNIENYVTTYEDNHQVTKEDLLEMLEFVRTKKESSMKVTEKDINEFNDNVKIVDNIANSLGSNIATEEAVSYYQYYLDEAEGEKTIFKDDPDRQKASDTGSFTKLVSIFMGISMDIISTRMKLIRRKYALSMRTLRHYLPENKEDNKKEEEPQINTDIQVKV